MYPEECDEEAGEEGDGFGGVVGVEALEHDEGGDEGCGGEADVVYWVDAGAGKS